MTYNDLSWLYKTIKSGNGTRISEKNDVSVHPLLQQDLKLFQNIILVYCLYVYIEYNLLYIYINENYLLPWRYTNAVVEQHCKEGV